MNSKPFFAPYFQGSHKYIPMHWNIFRVATKAFKCFQIFSGLLQMPFLSQDQRKVCVHSWRKGDRADVSKDFFRLRPKLSKLGNNCKSAKLCFWDLPVLVCTLPLPLNLQILEKLLHSGKLLYSYQLKCEKSKMRGRKKLFANSWKVAQFWHTRC